jgi:prepilin signal peptidase PulO-like enzyme (type II secretory pathway)
MSAQPAKLQTRIFSWQTGNGRSFITKAAAVGAIATVLIAWLQFDDMTALRVSVIGVALIACAATDLVSLRVPDVVTLPTLAFALAWSAWTGEPGIAPSVAGATMAGGLLLVAAIVTKGGLGGGDVKLGALLGAALGLPVAAFALAEGILLGGGFVICLFAMGRLERTQAFPFAPFLALSGLAYLLGG